MMSAQSSPSYIAALRSRQVQVLKDELSFYSRFHRNPVNRALHVVFVPLEWFSLLLAVKYSSLIGIPHASAIAGAIAVLFYIVLDPVAGLTWAPIQVGMVFLADAIWSAFGWQLTLWIAAAIQACSWGGQVGIGHWLVEKNQPGMATALTPAAVVLSPLLTWFDVLWALGLRRGLMQELGIGKVK